MDTCTVCNSKVTDENRGDYEINCFEAICDKCSKKAFREIEIQGVKLDLKDLAKTLHELEVFKDGLNKITDRFLKECRIGDTKDLLKDRAKMVLTAVNAARKNHEEEKEWCEKWLEENDF